MPPLRPRGQRRGIVIDGRAPLTFAEALAARSSPAASPGSRAGIGVSTAWEQVKDTIRGIGARSYDTRIGDAVPRSLPEFVVEATEAACSYYENLFNGGLPFVGGPGPCSPAAPGGGVAVKGAPLTLAEVTRSRPFDGPWQAKTVYVSRELAARLDATLSGVLARSYDTRIADTVPDTRTALCREAVEASCTYYQDLLNDGEPFPPGRRA